MKEDKKTLTKGQAAAVVGSTVGAVGLSGVGNIAAGNSLLKAKDNVTSEDIHKILQEVHPHGDVSIIQAKDVYHRLTDEAKKSPVADHLTSGGNSSYIGKNFLTKKLIKFNDKEKGLIVDGLQTPAKGSILAHEIGHSDKRSLIGKALASTQIPARLSAKYIPLAALSAAYGATQGLKGNKEFAKDHPKTKKAMEIAGGVGAAGVGLTLAEEARASLNARKYLKALGKTPKGLMAALATYGTGLATAPILAGGAAYGIGRYARKKREEEKNSALKVEGLYADPEYQKVQKKYNDGNLEDKFQFHAYKRALDRAIYNYHAKTHH